MVNPEKEEYKNKARFLYGESMGGAVALHIHRKEPHEWNGAILQAPMCKVLVSSSLQSEAHTFEIQKSQLKLSV